MIMHNCIMRVFVGAWAGGLAGIIAFILDSVFSTDLGAYIVLGCLAGVIATNWMDDHNIFSIKEN